MKKYLSVALVVAGIVGVAGPAAASEGGKSAYPNGAETLTIAALPPPGVYLIDYNYYYSADRLNDNDGKSVVPDFSVDAVANIPRFIFVTKANFLGATVAMQAFVPIVNLTVHAAGSRQSKFGVGDIIINPLVLGWNKKNTFFVVTMDTFVPTGGYKRTDLANIGNNYWTFEPLVAVTHFNPQGGPEFSAKFMYDFNTKNYNTKYLSGQMAHVDFAAAYNFNPVTVGVTVYYFKQTTDDKLNNQSAGSEGNRGETLALGPLVRYQLGKVPITAQWQHELFAHNRTEGNSFWLKAAFRF